ncbi:10441_t:CDS:2, partial [Racocetra fulgida]
MIVIGGAGESLSARPGINDLILKRRLGFLKIAIKSGYNTVKLFSLEYKPISFQNSASLCPVFSFGENDIWDQAENPEGSKVWKFQKFLQNTSGWTLPLFHGRVGKPIDVVKNDNPTEEEVLEVQRKYIERLYEIWNKYKDIYAKDRK